MDLTKTIAAVNTARKELQTALVSAAQDAKSIKALTHIAKADNGLVKSLEKLDDAVKSIVPKEKKAKAAKK